MKGEKKQQQLQQQPQFPCLSTAGISINLLPLLLLLLHLTFLLGACKGSPSAPSPAEDCTSVMLKLADCLSFVQEGSDATKPEGRCCPNLKEVGKTHVNCLCEGFKTSSSLGLRLNMTRALALPAACRLSIPALSHCDAASVHGVSAAPSPAHEFLKNAPVGSPPAEGGGGEMGAATPSPVAAAAPEVATIQIARGGILVAIAAVAAALYY